MATVVAVYLFTFLADKISCCNTAVLTEEEMEERRNATRVTKQSGLAGLLKEERNKIYHFFFESRSFPYLRPPETPPLVNTSISSINDDTPTDMDHSRESNERELDEKKHATTVKEADMEDGQAPTCSICLCEYGKLCRNNELLVLNGNLWTDI